MARRRNLGILGRTYIHSSETCAGCITSWITPSKWSCSSCTLTSLCRFALNWHTAGGIDIESRQGILMGVFQAHQASYEICARSVHLSAKSGTVILNRVERLSNVRRHSRHEARVILTHQTKT